MKLEILPVNGLGEINKGDDLGKLISDSFQIRDLDVVVVTQKVVSKSEGRVRKLDPNDKLGREKLILAESKRILRRRDDLFITETHHGFICANAGIDFSNVEYGYCVLLPKNPDYSAVRIKESIEGKTGKRIACIITDTFGRAFRNGLCDVAIGCAGIIPIVDLRNEEDSYGNRLKVTQICIADEIAAAAELVKGKSSSIPVVVVRGLGESVFGEGSVGSAIIRDPQFDLFR